MTTEHDAYVAKTILGELTLGDLWEMGLLEGMMNMDGNERITAGKNNDKLEFVSPEMKVFNFDSSLKIKINTEHLPMWAVDFEGHTLILSRSMETYLKND